MNLSEKALTEIFSAFLRLTSIYLAALMFCWIAKIPIDNNLILGAVLAALYARVLFITDKKLVLEMAFHNVLFWLWCLGNYIYTLI